MADAYALDIDAVASHLSAHGFEIDHAEGAVRLSGGLSNLNYLVVANGEKAVIRRPPAGDLPIGAHDMAREHRVLSRLSKAFPVAPDSYHLCADKTVIGVPFQLLEYRTGLVVRGDRLPQEFDAPSARRALSEELITTLAALHAVDAESIGLGDFGRPEGFFSRNVQGWLKRSANVAQGPSTTACVKEIGEWLQAQNLKPTSPTLLHSDFKLDNCMLTPDLRIGTVLDWDMGTRGDPLMDVATLMSYWAEERDPPCMHRLAQMPTAKPGFLDRAEAVALYGKITGRDVSDYPAWRVLALLKLGIVFMQLHQNWVRGAAGNESYREFDTLGAELLDYAHQVIRHHI